MVMATSVPLGESHVSCWPGPIPSGIVQRIVTTRWLSPPPVESATPQRCCHYKTLASQRMAVFLQRGAAVR
jgi:hypothetical protein